MRVPSTKLVVYALSRTEQAGSLRAVTISDRSAGKRLEALRYALTIADLIAQFEAFSHQGPGRF